MSFLSKGLMAGVAIGGGTAKFAGKMAISKPGQYALSGLAGGVISASGDEGGTVSQKFQNFAGGALAGISARGALGAVNFGAKVAGKSLMRKADRSMARAKSKPIEYSDPVPKIDPVETFKRKKGTAEQTPGRNWDAEGNLPEPPSPASTTGSTEADNIGTAGDEGPSIIDKIDTKAGKVVDQIIEKGQPIVKGADTLAGAAVSGTGSFFSKMDEWAGAAVQDAGGIHNVGELMASKAGRVVGKGLMYGTMGMMGSIAYGMTPDSKISSPTLAGNQVDVNYGRDQAAASSLNAPSVMPTGQTTAASLMRLSQSTQGLVQGLHRNRHG